MGFPLLGKKVLQYAFGVDANEFLAQFPERCPIAPENSRFSLEVRQLFYERKPHVYRILFTVNGDMVEVLHIRHGRRKRLTPGT
jgi:hypothetical protein